jgi:hypothetical protein
MLFMSFVDLNLQHHINNEISNNTLDPSIYREQQKLWLEEAKLLNEQYE